MSSVLPNKRFNTSTILHCLIRGPCGPGAPECVALLTVSVLSRPLCTDVMVAGIGTKFKTASSSRLAVIAGPPPL